MKSDIRNLDLNLLKALDALLDERSVTRAATRLSLTQPAVSGMLTRLREAFNDPLFIRAPHGMVPTLRAQALASPVKQLLADAEACSIRPPSTLYRRILPGQWRRPTTRSKRRSCRLSPR